MKNSKTYLFAVYKDNVCKMYTDSEQCIPPSDMLKSLVNAGYQIKMNGKTYNPVTKKEGR